MAQSILRKKTKNAGIEPSLMTKSNTWACILLADSRTPPKQSGTEESCSEGLVRHQHGRDPMSGNIWVFQTSVSSLKWQLNFLYQVLRWRPVSNYFWCIKKVCVGGAGGWEVSTPYIQTAVNPPLFTWCRKADSLHNEFLFIIMFLW